MRMRLFGYAAVAVVALIAPNAAWAASPFGFNLDRCCENATDIVMTDAEGRVLETWRGEFKPGEVLRLGAMRLTPANALPWEDVRLHPDRTLSPLYLPPERLKASWRGF